MSWAGKLGGGTTMNFGRILEGSAGVTCAWRKAPAGGWTSMLAACPRAFTGLPAGGGDCVWCRRGLHRLLPADFHRRRLPIIRPEPPSPPLASVDFASSPQPLAPPSAAVDWQLDQRPVAHGVSPWQIEAATDGADSQKSAPMLCCVA